MSPPEFDSRVAAKVLDKTLFHLSATTPPDAEWLGAMEQALTAAYQRGVQDGVEQAATTVHAMYKGLRPSSEYDSGFDDAIDQAEQRICQCVKGD